MTEKRLKKAWTGNQNIQISEKLDVLQKYNDNVKISFKIHLGEFNYNHQLNFGFD